MSPEGDGKSRLVFSRPGFVRVNEMNRLLQPKRNTGGGGKHGSRAEETLSAWASNPPRLGFIPVSQDSLIGTSVLLGTGSPMC